MNLSTGEDGFYRRRLKRVGVTCVCFNMRKATRMVTKHYDTILEPTGLRSTQFHILATVARHKDMPITRLAELLVMDRTTLTRNLKPLEKEEWIGYTTDQDRRRRTVHITSLGHGVLQKALPLWERAQERLLERIGEENSRGLLANLWRFVYGKRFLDA
ncbi:MAG: MarR family winged helix-turn-helix transcriptional regulator [Leptospirales bacterium]